MKKLILSAIIILGMVTAKGQTGTLTLPKNLATTAKCDTCKLPTISNTYTGNYGLAIGPIKKSDWVFSTSPAGIVARLSVKDSNGQQTGWFDKRYVKFTSDSTFVILSKSR